MKRIFATLLAFLMIAAITVQVSAEEAVLQNHCKGAKVEVSSVESADYKADYIVDGDITTRWSSERKDNQTVTIDLGVPLPIGYIQITWEAACAANYIVELSSDGSSWTTFGTKNNNKDLVNEFEAAATTNRFIKISCLKRATEYGFSIFEVVARESKNALAVNTKAAYPSSGYKPVSGSTIINGARIGAEGGWGNNPVTGRAAAFDGDIATFFDPTNPSVDYCGIDATKKFVLTGLLIHPRAANTARYNGATIEGANKEDFSDAVVLFQSTAEAKAYEWQDVSADISAKAKDGFRYYRYINYTSHGDVAEVEFYGYAVDGNNPFEIKVETTAKAASTSPAAGSNAPATFDVAVTAVVALAITGAALAVRKRRG